ncbi:hypothetical protein BRARA_I02335 [Brassica rapa]|uniref:Uncharacterized protein n=1 Tax=Brassica campestris TaxID=3711 RepID=A0A397XWD4_BRACM|nr:hypothetical protein BRARA_I02335 [Brassica rapa]
MLFRTSYGLHDVQAYVRKFITEILKLDTSCMFVKPQSEEMIRCEISNFRDQISFAKPTSSPLFACLLDV